MKIPETNNTRKLINSFGELAEQRQHMGASLLGHPCDRYLWLNFRWAIRQFFDARVLRIFRRGENEEAQIVADLQRSGVTVTEALSDQQQIDFGCHVKGTPDGVLLGLVEAPKTEHILEAKTHNQRSFADLVKNGVEKSKFQHFVQMQVNMLGRLLTRALYYSVNKNDDDIYLERVHLDKAIANKYIKRGQDLAIAERLPPPLIQGNATWYECKMCPAYSFCWENQNTTQVNCRTCAHSTPKPDSTWYCERWEASIPPEAQPDGCRSHVLHPDLVHWECTQYDQWNCYYDGKLNGEDGLSSIELVDPTVALIADMFDGEVL